MALEERDVTSRALTSSALLVAASLAVALLPQGALAEPMVPLCDGEPPVLTNRDAEVHTYTLRCNQRTERATIAARTSEKLEGKSGCSLTFRDSPPVVLSTETLCTIDDGALSCDLF